MATTIRTSDLDFDNIKSNLKTYFKSKSEFADYDFEASGLSNILDVLAYNTHINGLIANIATNESFLNTAQLRSSIVSHAEMLAYVPRSITASRASVNLSISISGASRPASVTLPANTSFTTSVDEVSYTFQTLEAYNALDNGNGVYNFIGPTGTNSIELVEGVQRTKTFIVGDVGETQVYVIPDNSIDTSTIAVKIYTDPSSSSFETYTDINRAIRITGTSTHYQVKEVPNGYYEIIFGDGSTLGKAPSPGNKIVVEYLSTKGPAANTADIFVPSTDLTISGIDYPISVVLVSESAGGAERESLESIRANAPITFASQQRMVTAEDYKAQIISSYSQYLDDVIAWGGNDNIPPVYGRVYVGLKFVDGINDVVKQTVKDSIINDLTNNLAIMSIDTVFADPIESYLELTTVFNFDPDLTGSTAKTTENLIKNTINTYFNSTLNKFNAVFRRSNILSTIDDLDAAILNSRMDVKVQQRIVPVPGVSTNFVVSFPMVIATPDDKNRIVTTSKFIFLDRTCTITNKFNSKTLQIIDLNGNVVLDNIGAYDDVKGTVTLVSFTPQSFEGDYMAITVIPANQSTIRPLRNYVLKVDNTRSFATAVIDYQNTSTTLS